VLNACGFKAEALGNVGIPLISRVDEEGIGVVELSSYQLERIATPALLGGALLNITPDHLDRYHTMAAYAQAKFRMTKILKPQAPFIVHRQTAADWPQLTPENAVIYGGEGKSHDEENMQAAFLLTQIFGITEVAFQKAIKSFQKPPHRIEWVRELEGTNFWNDSKGTNIDATLRAVEAMKGPVVLIAGGVDKGHPYTLWKPLFKEKVKQVIVLGEAKEKIIKDLQGVVPLTRVTTLQEAVKIAFEKAEKGDDVLLSPGCSSFDMFRDYEDRGEQFKSLVRSLS
jgi:UDP-N-acetylmuramoylalanine--D-glutamate ligase